MTETIVALQAEVAALKAEQEKLEAVAEEAERGTAKGRTYEEQVADAIADDRARARRLRRGRRRPRRVAAARRATSSSTSTPRPARRRAASCSRSRPHGCRTPRRSASSTPRWSSRSAAFGVLVVPSEDEGARASCARCRSCTATSSSSPTTPTTAATLALETGYALARARVLMAALGERRRRRRGDRGGRRSARIELLGQVKAIKAGLTGAKTHIDRSAEAVDAMSRAVREQLDEVCALARAGDDGDEPTRRDVRVEPAARRTLARRAARPRDRRTPAGRSRRSTSELADRRAAAS